MSSTKRDRTTSSSPSPENHTEKRPRIEEEDASTDESSSQSPEEALMDISWSFGSEPDMNTTARRSSSALVDQRPSRAPESETFGTDTEMALTEDDEPGDHDKTEDDRSNEENHDDDMDVVSWGWGDAHFLHELNPTSQISNEQESDTSYSDTRISLWQQEDRVFAGVIFQEYPEKASPIALSASRGPFEIQGVPQLSLFCDGSIKNIKGQGWKEWRL
ncbi:hypothetical protein B0T13DRAFT_447225 [Neurospora crassa]|nr:hypothetical protein B0T13DRAFT_447225 [Neurospora crassa]